MTVLIPIEDLQRAVYERLSQDAALQAAGGAVYDEVPEDAAAPYVQLAEQRHRSFNAKGASGWEATFEVNVWSTYRGTREVAAVANLVAAAMNANYALPGFQCLALGFDAIEVTKARQGDVHGMMAVVRQKLKILPQSG